MLTTLQAQTGETEKAVSEQAASQGFYDKHMINVTQLTFKGDNGEAYFSSDGQRLIYQSNRNGFACDKIWIMNIDGSGKRMVSPNQGAHTCSFFYPGGQQIVFASTSHLAGACPPKPQFPPSIRYAWPLTHMISTRLMWMVQA